MNNSNENKYRLRVKYCKVGPLRFLSHLEVLTSIQNTIRRANLPFAVSCGYSPHMLVSFGPALSLGIQSLSEYFDVVLTKYVNPDTALNCLKEASCNFLFPISCEYVENNAESIDCTFKSYKYLAILNGDCCIGNIEQKNKDSITPEKQARCFTQSFSKDDIVIPNDITFLKKGKKKTVHTSDVVTGDIDVISLNKVIDMLSSKISLDTNELANLMLFSRESNSAIFFTLITNLGNSIKASIFVENVLKESSIDLTFLDSIIKF